MTQAITNQVNNNPAIRVSRLAVAWDVVEEHPDIYGGLLITFRLQEAYDGNESRHFEAYEQLRRRIFPAVEPNHNVLPFKLDRLKDFGYGHYSKNGRTYIVLPDQKALNLRFEEYRRKYPELNLQPLVVRSSAGIATDMEYTKAYSEATVLLSTELEFVHDHFYHIILTLLAILENSSMYYKERARIEKIVQDIYQQVLKIERAVQTETRDCNCYFSTQKEVKQLQFFAGSFTDSIWNLPNLGRMAELQHADVFKPPFSFLFKIWGSPDSYRRIWEERFSKTVTERDICYFWQQCLDYKAVAEVPSENTPPNLSVEE